jgi:stress response protein YsnF
LVPPYWANYQFEDAIKTEALMATNSTKTEEAIRETVYKRAREFDIPLEKEKIKVQHVGGNGSGSVSIEAPYVVEINIPGYPITLNFNPMTTNKGVF